MKMLMLVFVIFAVMWVLTIRPQQKKAKELAAAMKTLKAGDKIQTTGGIIGFVVSLKEGSNTITIRTGGDNKIELLKSSVAEILERGSKKPASDPAADKS